MIRACSFLLILIVLSVVATHRMLVASTSDTGDRVSFEVSLTDPVAPELPAKSYRVVQLRDKHGFPAGYSLAFTTHVCVDQQCRIVRVTMFWDALGNYQRLEYPVDWPLTKKKHEPFTPEDYDQLDHILKDKASILATYTPAAIDKEITDEAAATTSRDADLAEVDGISGATPLTVKQSVVHDAAYTTWTMWRWANGEIVPKLLEQTEQHCDFDFLRFLLQSGERTHVDFALKYVMRHFPKDPRFIDGVFHVLETSDREHIKLSLEFLGRASGDQEVLHKRLIESCCRMRSIYSPMIIDYFASRPSLSPASMEQLCSVMNRLPYFQVHLILRLLDRQQFFSSVCETHIAKLLDSDDFFIARRAAEYLQEHATNGQTLAKIESFREQNRDRL